MGSDSQFQLPVVEVSSNICRGTEEWDILCKSVREACESFGCFEVICDKVSGYLRGETFSLMKELFGLPFETKKKNVSSKPYHGYYGREPVVPLYESFGLEDASNYDSLKKFSQLMWPDADGYNQFCQTINSLTKQLEDLRHSIWLTIIDSYGLGKKMESIIPCDTLMRVMKYEAPPAGAYTQGIPAHRDKGPSVLLCEENISGLEIETKDERWFTWLPSTAGSFIFIVGEALMAWSNGRMHAAKHRVMMVGEKDRYSFGAFAVPVEGTVIETPEELVDEEHPKAFRAYNFMEYIRFTNTDEGRAIPTEKKLSTFAATLS